jgi:coenzyme F420-reducing hydrogenase alpha subunit
MAKETINVPALARVEGEGGLYIGVKDGKVQEIKVNIYEPPRFFEGFLRGRFLQDVPDITARICGICPVAYQFSSIRAMEKALGITAPPQVTALRKMLYYAEWIESHVLHIYMLQGPDLTGHESVITLAADAPQVVANALRAKKAGNDTMSAIAGRSVHPVNACVGGWYRWPDKAKLEAMLPELRWGLEFAKETVKWATTLPYPELEIDDYEFVAVHNENEYGILEGDIISSIHGVLAEEDYEKYYAEKHVEHSNALHSHAMDGAPYMVGPLARFNLNFDQLGETAKQAAKENGVKPGITNPYKQLIARAVETVQAFDMCIQLIEAYDPSGPSYQPLELKKGNGCAASEAPRGLLFHRYEIDENGLVEFARIVPPTAQNLARMEADLSKLMPQVLEMPHDEATLTCEHLLRAYDPCISCATHFLTLTVEEK